MKTIYTFNTSAPILRYTRSRYWRHRVKMKQPYGGLGLKLGSYGTYPYKYFCMVPDSVEWPEEMINYLETSCIYKRIYFEKNNKIDFDKKDRYLSYWSNYSSELPTFFYQVPGSWHKSMTVWGVDFEEARNLFMDLRTLKLEPASYGSSFEWDPTRSYDDNYKRMIKEWQ